MLKNAEKNTRHHVGKSDRKFKVERGAAYGFFTLFKIVAVSQAGLRYAIGVKYEEIIK